MRFPNEPLTPHKTNCGANAFVTTLTRLPRDVYFCASSGSAWIASHAAATPRRVRERQVELVRQRFGRRDRNLAGFRIQVISESAQLQLFVHGFRINE
jgi:hypothetical protein